MDCHPLFAGKKDSAVQDNRRYPKSNHNQCYNRIQMCAYIIQKDRFYHTGWWYEDDREVPYFIYAEVLPGEAAKYIDSLRHSDSFD